MPRNSPSHISLEKANQPGWWIKELVNLGIFCQVKTCRYLVNCHAPKNPHFRGKVAHPKPCIRFLWGFGMRIFFEFYSWWIGFDEWELPFSSHRLFERKDGHEIDSLWVPKLDKIPLKLRKNEVESTSSPRKLNQPSRNSIMPKGGTLTSMQTFGWYHRSFPAELHKFSKQIVGKIWR